MRNPQLNPTSSVQQNLLATLSYFDSICREHNLTYYLWAGTQLGAIRHEGFIPWDDDADVAMPRADYEKLMAHYDEWVAKPYGIATFYNTAKYPHYFARIHDTNTTMIIRKHLGYVEGVHVDIFPLDNVPDNKFSRWLHFKGLNFYYRLLYMALRSPKKDNKRRFCLFYKFLQSFLKREKLLAKVDRYIKRYNDTKCLNCTDSFYGAHAYVAYETLGNPIKYNFEGVELLGVENGAKYLADKYGEDYMTLPPIENRRQHSVDFLDLNLPFEKFDFKMLE